MDCATKHDGLSCCQHRYLVKKPLCLPWNDPTEVIDVIGVLQAMRKEVCTLTDDGGTDLAGALACNDEGQAEFATFLGDAFKSLP